MRYDDPSLGTCLGPKHVPNMFSKHVPKTYLRLWKYMQNTYLGCVLYVILTRYVQVSSDVFGNLLVRLRDVFGDHDTRPL